MVLAIVCLSALPSALAATQIHAFRGHADRCEIPLRECDLHHVGTIQVDCQQATCVLALNMNASYEGGMAATSKLLRAYGRDWSGAASADACRTRTGAETARCSGLAMQAVTLPLATCRYYQAIAEVVEQPLNFGSIQPLAEQGIRHTSTTTLQICRNGLGSVTVAEA